MMVRLNKAQDQRLQFWQRIICNHDPCVTIRGDCIDRVDCSKRGLNTFRNACDTKADLGQQGRSARRLETHHRSGPSAAKPKQSTSQMDVDTHLCDREVSTNAFLKNEAVKEEHPQIRILKSLNKSNLVRMKRVFAKIWRRRRWCSAKSEDKLFSRWAMWSSLS